MPSNRKISELATDAAPARTDFLTSLENGILNVKGLVSSFLGLTNDSDINFTDITTGDVSPAKHGFVPKLPTGATAYLNNASYLQYRDEKAQNTGGGTFTSGAWRTRVLNTEVADVGGFGTLASNQITLAAGTYIISAKAPAFACNQNQLRLQNVTDAITVLVGQAAYSSVNTQSDGSTALLNGIFTIAASKALELQHQCVTTAATIGFGVQCNFTTEVYAVVELWKIG